MTAMMHKNCLRIAGFRILADACGGERRIGRVIEGEASAQCERR